ncbi:MAG: YcxB family protein [Pseudomonadota bacterium]
MTEPTARRAAADNANAPRFVASYDVTWDDFVALCDAHTLWKAKWRRSRWVHWALTALIFGLGLFYLTAPRLGQTNNVLGAFLVAGALFLLLLEFVLVPWARKRSYARQELHNRTVKLVADPTGLHLAQTAATSHVAWSGFERADRFRHGTVIWLKGRQALFVPDRAFATPDGAAEFHAHAMEKIAGATSQTE